MVFGEVLTRLAAYLKSTFGLSAKASTEAAQRLLGQVLYPRLPRALFGIDPLIESLDVETAGEIDVKPIRKAVAELIASLPKP